MIFGELLVRAALGLGGGVEEIDWLGRIIQVIFTSDRLCLNLIPFAWGS